jgi:hypothetical protein
MFAKVAMIVSLILALSAARPDGYAAPMYAAPSYAAPSYAAPSYDVHDVVSAPGI